MTFRFVGSALAVAVVCAVGCGSQAGGEQVGSSTSDIQGGAMDTSHNFAVAVCGGVNQSSQYQCQLLCSGALIAPNLVVSARHCVDQVLNEEAVDGGGQAIDCSTTTFGSLLFPAGQYYVTADPNIYDPKATWFQVSQIITPTPTEFCGNDLSLLVLTSDVPAKDVPVLVTPEIWYPIDSPRYSSTETAIGYGQDAAGPGDAAINSSGVRRILEDINLACIPGDPALPCIDLGPSGPVSNEFAAGDGPCEGDSGSSAYEQTNFDDGTWLSLGVLSRGGVDGSTCVGSVYTQLYPWQSLILSTAKQAMESGGYPAPAWTVNPSDAAPPPDTGAAPTDSGSPDSNGASLNDEAGGTESGALSPLGASCSTDRDCSSNVCVSATGADGFVCSTTCTPSEPCSSGYDCLKGYCFAGSDSGAGTVPPHGGGGCSVGRGNTGDLGTAGLGWAGVAVAVAVACNLRRRRDR